MIELLQKKFPAVVKEADAIREELSGRDEYKPLRVSPSAQEGTGRALMSNEIDRLMSKVPGFQGTIASDEPLHAKSESPKGVSWVMNLDKRSQPGSHWVAILITPHSAEYYNSYGDPPTPEVRARLVAEGKRLWPDNVKTLKINSVKQQDERSETCGWFATKFITDRLKGKSWKEVLGYDGQVRKREADVDAFERRYPKFIQIGKGILDHPGDNMPYVVKRELGKYGQDTIKSITVGRTPIERAVKAAVSLLSGNKLNGALSKYNYEDLYHLFIIVVTTRGVSIRMEKNATVQMYLGTMPRDAATVPVPNIPPDTRVEALYKDSSKPGFWLYSAGTNNCQNHILNLLGAIGVLTPEIRTFVKQDVDKLGRS